MCTRPIHFVDKGLPVTYACGHCAECTKKRQNDYMVKLTLAARQWHPLWFETLTYRPETLPYRIKQGSRKAQFVDDFDVIEKFYPEICMDNLREIVHTAYEEKRPSQPDKGSLPLDIDIFGQTYTVCPSLRRRDFQLHRKRFDIRWRRLHPDERLSYKFCLVGEHGMRYYRPHYHMLVFGMSDEQMKLFLHMWKQEYGNFDFNGLSPLNQCGDDDAAKVAMYCSKYMNKGSFEVPHVRDLDIVEKPRVQISSNIFDLSDQLGQDLIRHLLHGMDPNMPCTDPQVLDMLMSTSKISIGQYQYKPSSYIINRIFKEKYYVLRPKKNPTDRDYERLEERSYYKCLQELEQGHQWLPHMRYQYPDEIATRYKSLPLKVSLLDYAQYLHLVDRDKELDELQRTYPDKNVSEIYKLQAENDQQTQHSREQDSNEDLRRTYRRSRF